jgi:thioester reductase-like protein
MRAHTDEHAESEHIFVTGFPAFTARRMLAKIAREDDSARIVVLCRDKFRAELDAFIATLPAEHGERMRVLIGDVCDMDLGLSGEEYAGLAQEVTTIHHLAGIYYMGVDRRTAERVNVEGTRGVLALATESPKLRRLVHWSTASVSGKRRGVVMEDELDVGQHFHNFYEETKLTAERLARAAQRQLPISIVRPSIIVGDSQSGEIDKFDGPYYLMVLIATNALSVRIPMPGRGTAPLHVVPIDYVIDAAYAISLAEEAAGKTFHLTDPDPFPAKRVYELVAELSDTKLARGRIPGSVTRTLMRTPGLERLTRAPRAFLESFDQQVFYNRRNTQQVLRNAGVECPPFDSYAERLVQYVRSVRQTRQSHLQDEVFDPFD